MYSFTDGFLGYHHIRITKEDRHKSTFATKWGCFQYTVIPFGLENAPAIFPRIVVVSFKYFIHKFLEVYFDDWDIFGLIMNHIESLEITLEHCRRYEISLNLKKCIFCTPFGILLGHVVYHNGMLVYPTKIVIILDLPPSTIVKKLRATQGHKKYYINFIKGYAEVIAPMEKLLKKDIKFQWIESCRESLDTLKDKMVTKPILVFP